jgi:hypothetical protein
MRLPSRESRTGSEARTLRNRYSLDVLARYQPPGAPVANRLHLFVDQLSQTVIAAQRAI